MTRLNRDFFIKDVLEVAPLLLGAKLVVNANECLSCYTITEVEAYRGEEDLACHASKGRTKRTEIMYNNGGHVYVYLIYGVHWMFNIVTGEVDNPQAVLLRGVNDCIGPGRVGKLLGINKDHYGIDLVHSDQMWLEESPNNLKQRIETKPRVGVEYAGQEWANKNWRYILTI